MSPAGQPFVLPISEDDAAIDLVGGKGRSLCRLVKHGLPVPGGFLITTFAHRTYPDPEIERTILESYRVLGADAVAVRSSATAEDLPDHSFAGLHDTYLNVRGEPELLRAIHRCWASLWSERAVSYRRRMGISDNGAAIGVIVQIMIDADVSGVLFTANPATGDRSELVVNATFGLGEALVSGTVTPDSFVLDRETLSVKESRLAIKSQMIVPNGRMGTRIRPVPEDRRSRASLSDRMLADLGGLALRAERAFGDQPQDIEWAIHGERCWLVQSRPITGLPPQPLRDVTWQPPEGVGRLLRRQVVENMPGPLSPLFEELYLHSGLNQGMEQLAEHMALPIPLDELARRPLFTTVNGFGYIRYDLKLSWGLLRHLPRLLYWMFRTMPKVMAGVVPTWRDRGLRRYRDIIGRWQGVDIEAASDETLVAGIRELAFADAAYWYFAAMVVGAAKISEAVFDRFMQSRLMKMPLASGELLRGFPSMTMQAQEDLEAIADVIRADTDLREAVLVCPPQELLGLLTEGSTAPTVREAVAEYLSAYGHQIYTLDFAEPTQGESLSAVGLELKRLVAGDDSGRSQARRAEVAGRRARLAKETMASLGPLRGWCFRKLLARAEQFAPYREDALFYMGAGWPALRRIALALGHRLVAAGTLQSADDVFFLTCEELLRASSATRNRGVTSGIRSLARERRMLRESRRTLHPPARVPEDLRFKFGPFDFTAMFEVWETQKRNDRDSDVLLGFAVSRGSVTGLASVVRSHEEFGQMQPGTILVCPTTTPAWTPLLAHALGLVTDIGAPLAHGSIIAREYGIPAVLGTGNATQRIRTGQRITVNGDTGQVVLQ